MTIMRYYCISKPPKIMKFNMMWNSYEKMKSLNTNG